MNQLLLFSFCMLFLVTVSSAASNQPSVKKKITQKGMAVFLDGGDKISAAEFLALTPKSIREKTGKRLGWQKSIALKAAQKKMRKNMASSNRPGNNSQVVALFLAIFLGVLGIHRFYLGYNGYGLLMLLTLGLYGILAVIDMVLIATGNLKPKEGYYSETLD